MYALIASAALALVTMPAPPAAPTQTIQPVTTAPAFTQASRRQNRRERIALAVPAGSAYDDTAQRQNDLHVLMPALTGDGGG